MVPRLIYSTVLQDRTEHPRDAVWTHYTSIGPCHHLIDWMATLDLFRPQPLEVRDGLVNQSKRSVTPVGFGVVLRPIALRRSV